MPTSLVPHPDSICAAVNAIDVVVQRHAGKMFLQYALRGTLADVAIPDAVPSTPADGLWQHTCFEAFVLPGNSSVYYELNFSPSTQWAAYRFDAYRSGMKTVSVEAPTITMRREASVLLLETSIRMEQIFCAALRIGLSAVIEERNGRKTYWALSHLPGKPDFHRTESFLLQLPAI